MTVNPMTQKTMAAMWRTAQKASTTLVVASAKITKANRRDRPIPAKASFVSFCWTKK